MERKWLGRLWVYHLNTYLTYLWVSNFYPSTLVSFHVMHVWSTWPIAILSKLLAEKAMATHSSTLAWKIPWTEEPGRLQSMGSLGVGHDGVTSLSPFHFHALEKEMATHSIVLAWRIPGMGEPGGLPFMGLHRVGHDWSDLAAAAAYWLIAGLGLHWYLVVTVFRFWKDRLDIHHLQPSLFSQSLP